MKLKLIAAAAMLAASFGASAATVDLGPIDPTGDNFSINSVKFAKNDAIDDWWKFELSVPSSAAVGALQTFSVSTGMIGQFSGILFKGATEVGTLSLVGTGGTQTLNWNGVLGSGDYSVEILGTSKAAKTQYSFQLSVTPVPEPETYGMMLGGLALLGMVARRKAKKAV